MTRLRIDTVTTKLRMEKKKSPDNTQAGTDIHSELDESENNKNDTNDPIS